MDLRSLNRLLSLVKRELNADDARVELGGRPPDAPGVLHASLGEDARVVAVFDAPIDDEDTRQEKLALLASSFDELVALPVRPSQPAPQQGDRALVDALDALRDAAAARAAVVIDDSSPVIWGAALAPGATVDGLDVPAAHRLAERFAAGGRVGNASEDELDLARVIDWVRSDWPEHEHRLARSEDGLSVLARSFATTYRVFTVHRGVFSELHAEAALGHALPLIESLVTRLPPLEPGGGEGSVVRLARRKV